MSLYAFPIQVAVSRILPTSQQHDVLTIILNALTCDAGIWYGFFTTLSTDVAIFKELQSYTPRSLCILMFVRSLLFYSMCPNRIWSAKVQSLMPGVIGPRLGSQAPVFVATNEVPIVGWGRWIRQSGSLLDPTTSCHNTESPIDWQSLLLINNAWTVGESQMRRSFLQHAGPVISNEDYLLSEGGQSLEISGETPSELLRLDL